ACAMGTPRRGRKAALTYRAAVPRPWQPPAPHTQPPQPGLPAGAPALPGSPALAVGPDRPARSTAYPANRPTSSSGVPNTFAAPDPPASQGSSRASVSSTASEPSMTSGPRPDACIVMVLIVANRSQPAAAGSPSGRPARSAAGAGRG